MSPQSLKKAISFETTFGVYTVSELLGEGGAGRVYGGIGLDEKPVAIKVLAEERASADKRRRFKNEIAFLERNKHTNIVTVIDRGLARDKQVTGPFYVMHRYDKNFRLLINDDLSPEHILPLFIQILDGIEAAHIQGVIHRDLKPENVLYDPGANILAIADFGIARFSEEFLATSVETTPAQRLANFAYAAPEQRAPGQTVTASADIYALGLMLNEMFTGTVPHGTEYQSISDISREFGFLDPIVAKMLRQTPKDRPASVAEIKGLIQQHYSEEILFQKLSKIEGTVIKRREIDEPLALSSPKLIGIDWKNRELKLKLDRQVTAEWKYALLQMGNFSSLLGKGPEMFLFNGDEAIVEAEEHQVQRIVTFFKDWLPQATKKLKEMKEQAALQEEAERLDSLRRQREAEEQRLRVLRNTKI